MGQPCTQKYYLCIDLKCFYASVECVDRGLDPFVTNLVVADPERTEKTICLAITPAMKKLGVRNRCRVFEIPKHINYIKAKPRMKRYMEMSTFIFSLYLRYVSAQDIHVYSIDECFIDITPYLSLYNTTPREFANRLISCVFEETGICATAGIGTNLFLAKVALDVTAKHVSDNIGFLDEARFRKEIWFHKPITDIWSIGPGVARRLARYGVYDLAGVAAMNEKTLYKEFGVTAEYLIDHAWGQEPCTMEQIHAYKPKGHSISQGQVLACSYSYEEARIVLREMVDASVLDLISKGLVTNRIFLMIGYDKDTSALPKMEVFIGEHGKHPRSIPAELRAGGSRKLSRRTNSFQVIMASFEKLFAEEVDKSRTIKRINIGFGSLYPESSATLTLFDNVEKQEEERRKQDAILAIRERFGKNALLKGTSLKEKATARERNEQVGGHHA